MWKVQLFKLNYDRRESQAVQEVLESAWITMGEKTMGFEEKFSQFLGSNVRATAVSNGTAALHLALLSLDIRQGDEVIIPALTFVADINVVRMVGAKPVLADCHSYYDWNVSAKTIKEKITEKTKAVIIVHYAGEPCDMEEIVTVCQEHNIYLIEDVAHAPGAKYKGQSCGSFGDIGCFSFFTNKNLSVGEGGMFVTKSEDLDKKAKYLRSHGMTALTLDRHKGRAISYDVVLSGLNYRIDEIRAALGLVQLEKLINANKQREILVKEYRSRLNDMDNISLPFKDTENKESAYHIFPVLLDDNLNREGVIEIMKNNGIQTSIHYPAFKEFTAFKDLNLGNTIIADDISKRELTLPLYPTMTMEEVCLVINSLKKALMENK